LKAAYYRKYIRNGFGHTFPAPAVIYIREGGATPAATAAASGHSVSASNMRIAAAALVLVLASLVHASPPPSFYKGHPKAPKFIRHVVVPQKHFGHQLFPAASRHVPKVSGIFIIYFISNL